MGDKKYILDISMCSECSNCNCAERINESEKFICFGCGTIINSENEVE